MQIYTVSNAVDIKLSSYKIADISAENNLAATIAEISAADVKVEDDTTIVGPLGQIILLARDIVCLSLSFEEVAKMRDADVLFEAFGEYNMIEVFDI